MSTPDIRDMLLARATDGDRGYKLVDDLLDDIIALLRQNPRFRIPRFEFELLFADLHQHFADVLADELRNKIHIDDAEDVVRYFAGDY
jgi:hypothetical protein